MKTLYIRNGTEFREATPEEILAHSTVTARLSELENDTRPRTFHVRNLLVGADHDLRIKGRWFELAGFSRGARVSVQVFTKRLIIDLVQEPAKFSRHHYFVSTQQLSMQ
jgi:hypothetical protein